MAICLLTTVCLAMTILVFEPLSISSGTDMTPYVATSDTVLTANFEVVNFNFLVPIFTPIKIVSALVACFSILLIVLTYGLYGKVLSKSYFSTYIPLTVWALSFIVIYFNQPNAPWQVWIGLFALCFSAYVLTILDENEYQGEH